MYLKRQAKPTTSHSRIFRFLHLFGTATAVLSLGLLAAVGSRFIQQGQTPPMWLVAAIFATVIYIIYAYLKTNALAKQEAKLRIKQANETFKQLEPEELSAGISLRWGTKTYAIYIVSLAVTGAVAVLGWVDELWLILGFSSVSFLFLLKSLLTRLAHPVVLRISPRGIEDHLRYGLILWKDVESVRLHEQETRGAKIATLSITVREPQIYLQRLGTVIRFLLHASKFMMGQGLRISLHTLNKEPLVVFRLVQSFHEGHLPRGAIHGSDTFYFVNLELTKFQ